MIGLYTDFGWGGFYVGQMHAALAVAAPGQPVIDLMHDAPAFAPKPAGYLLAAQLPYLPVSMVVVAVIDPGVGTDRQPLVVRAGGRRLVGPDNGLFEPVLRRAAADGHADLAAWRITWRPPALSASFHGRDLFAPVAGRLAADGTVPGEPLPVDAVRRPDWPDDLAEVVHIDGYGNALTGLRAAMLPSGARLTVGDRRLERGRTFGDRPAGTAFWYENSVGLAEIAVAEGSAAETLALTIGTSVTVD